MIKPLIAIQSCQKNTDKRQAQRWTWLQDVPCDYKYFIGGSTSNPAPDEIALDVRDDYSALTAKMKAIALYAWEHGYTHMFKCDDDAYVRPKRLLKSGFENYPYIGWYCPIGAFNLPAILKSGADHFARKFPSLLGAMFAAGDAGYWLDRRMIYFVSHFPPIEADSSGEDHLTGMIAGYHDILLHNDTRYVPEKIPEGDMRTLPPENEAICLGGRSPQQMGVLYLQDHGEGF